MTYRLNPIIECILSPVTIIFPDTGQKSYGSGAEAAADTFDKQFNIRNIRAEDSTVVIEMEVAGLPDTTFF